MSNQVIGTRVLALVGAIALQGCGAADDSQNEDVAGRGSISTAGRANAPAGGATWASPGGSGGTTGFATAGSAGAPGPRGGSGGVAGATSSAGFGGFAGSAGSAGRSGSAGSAGAPTTPEIISTIGTDPECARVTPVQGAVCDERGPLVCPSGTRQCICAALTDAPATWTCFDLGTGTGGDNGGFIGFAGAGGASSFGPAPIGGNSGQDFGIGGVGSDSFGFAGAFGRL